MKKDDSVTYHHRASSLYISPADRTQPLKKGPRNADSDRTRFLCPKIRRNPGNWSLSVIWDMFKYEIFIQWDEPILSCDLEEKGPGLVHCNSPNYYDPLSRRSPGDSENTFGCGTVIIRQGRIAPVSEFSSHILLNTEIVIPSTCYDYEGMNVLLPNGINDEGEEGTGNSLLRQYLVLLSEDSIPLERYSWTRKGFYEKTQKKVVVEGKERMALVLNSGVQESGRNRGESVDGSAARGGGNPEDKTLCASLLNQLSGLCNSSSQCLRLEVSSAERSPKTRIPRPGVLPRGFPRFSALQPHEIAETEVYRIFLENTGKELSSHCSYGYKQQQFALFERGTNQVINAEIYGGVVVAMYLDNQIDITKDMILENSYIDSQIYFGCFYFVFACLYPPEDKEMWKKYAVCTSPFTRINNCKAFSPKVDITNSMFTVYPDPVNKPEERHHAFMCHSAPFYMQCNSGVPSFVKYLPCEEGWVDVETTKRKVYTQVLMNVTVEQDIFEAVIKYELRDHVMTIVGTPKADGSLVDWAGVIPLRNQMANISSTGIVDSYEEFTTYCGLPNEFCQVRNLSCTPSDFIVQKTKTQKQKQNENQDQNQNQDKDKDQNQDQDQNWNQRKAPKLESISELDPQVMFVNFSECIHK